MEWMCACFQYRLQSLEIAGNSPPEAVHDNRAEQTVYSQELRTEAVCNEGAAIPQLKLSVSRYQNRTGNRPEGNFLIGYELRYQPNGCHLSSSEPDGFFRRHAQSCWLGLLHFNHTRPPQAIVRIVGNECKHLFNRAIDCNGFRNCCHTRSHFAVTCWPLRCSTTADTSRLLSVRPSKVSFQNPASGDPGFLSK